MTSLSYQISSLLEKMTSTDKDFRYMATNDLMAELQRDSITLDDDTERKIVRALLSLLNDKNCEVQNLTIRCLGPLVHKIKSQQLDSIVSVLCTNMESPEERLRDVSSIALKTVIMELPSNLTQQTVSCVQQVVPRLIEGLRKDDKTAEVSVKLEMLEILSILISRYGRFVTLDFNDVEKVVLQQMDKERQALKKRAVIVLGFLTEVVGNTQYSRIVNTIYDACLANKKNLFSLRIYVLSASAICRSSSARFSPFLPKFIELFIKYCRESEDDELREVCIQTFEIFILRCTQEVENFVPEIVQVVGELLKYDPNYNYDDVDMTEDESTEMETDELSEGCDDDGSELDDDDDFSWKVRRASAKCIEALIACRSYKLLENYKVLGPLLLDRIKEREESVKSEVFNAYASLLRQARFLMPNKLQKKLSFTSDLTLSPFSVVNFMQVLKDELGADQYQVFETLKSQIPDLVKSLKNELKGNNLRIRQKCFFLLDNLLRAYPGALSSNVGFILNLVKKTLMDKGTDGNMKVETLRFITTFLYAHELKDLCSYIDSFTTLIYAAINDSFYKISGEGLSSAQALVRVIRPDFCDDLLDYNKLVHSLYEVIVAKMKITDIDQEVKEKTIVTMGHLVAIFYRFMESEMIKESLLLLIDRLKNEMTRLVSIKAFQTIISCSSKIDFSNILPDLLTQLADFLRKNQRTLRINALTLLEQLINRFAQNGLQSIGLIKVVKEIPNLISETDLQITLFSLRFITDVVSSYPDQISENLPSLFDSLIKLTQGSLLQGATLNAALNLFSTLIKSPLPSKPSFEQVTSRLSSVIYNSEQLLHRQTYISVGKAIAIIVLSTNEGQKSSDLVKNLCGILSNKNNDSSDSVQLFSIITLGEIGRICPSNSTMESTQLGNLIMNSFNSHSEEIKIAASYALGSIAVGDMSKFLAFILDEIDRDQKKQYLLLHSLKEVIVSESLSEDSSDTQNKTFMQYVKRIWDVLIKNCDCAEEGIRNIVAECIGKLCLVDPNRFLPELERCISNKSPRVRGTVVTSIRFMISDQPQAIDTYLQPSIENFLASVRDDDLQVRRVAIITLNSVLHNKPKMIRDCLQSLLPALYEETKVRSELVREVEMGPFKHIVDGGLDLRKATFECMYTLSEQCLDRLDIAEFLSKLENGLSDQHDIKLLTHLMLIRMTLKCPVHMAQRADNFCEHIKPQLLTKPKQNAVKQENEKLDELKRSAIRAFIALKRTLHNQPHQKVGEVMETIRSNTELFAMLETVEKEQSDQNIFTGNEIMEVE